MVGDTFSSLQVRGDMLILLGDTVDSAFLITSTPSVKCLQ